MHIVTAIWAFAVLSAATFSAASPPSEPPPELRKARENSKLSEQTRDRIAEEVAALKASGKASPEVVAAYEVYLARVQEIVIEHQKLVAQMEAAYSAHQGRIADRGCFRRSGRRSGSRQRGRIRRPFKGTGPPIQ